MHVLIVILLAIVAFGLGPVMWALAGFYLALWLLSRIFDSVPDHPAGPAGRG